MDKRINADLPVSPRIEFHPYNLLKAVGRDTGGKGGFNKALKINKTKPSNANVLPEQCSSNQNQNQTIKYNREKIDIFDLGDGLQIGQQTIDAINDCKTGSGSTTDKWRNLKWP